MNIYAVAVTTVAVSGGLGPVRVYADSEEEAKAKFAAEEGRDVPGLEASGLTQWMVTHVDTIEGEPEPEPEPAPLPDPPPIPDLPEPEPDESAPDDGPPVETVVDPSEPEPEPEPNPESEDQP